MNAVDTNVFVYFFDDEEPAKQTQATTLLDQLVQPPSETVLLWQVAGELLSCLRRWQWAGKRVGADVHADIRDVLAMFPLLRFPRRTSSFGSLDLNSRYSLSHWGRPADRSMYSKRRVETLYSEDLDHAARCHVGGRCRIRFVDLVRGPEELRQLGPQWSIRFWCQLTAFKALVESSVEQRDHNSGFKRLGRWKPGLGWLLRPTWPRTSCNHLQTRHRDSFGPGRNLSHSIR